MLDDRLGGFVSKDSTQIPAAKNPANVGRNNEHSINARIKICPECRSKNLVLDPVHAEMSCSDCGMVIEENQIVPTLDNLTYSDGRHYSPYPSKPLTPYQKSKIVPYNKSLRIQTNGTPLPSKLDIIVEDIVKDLIQEVRSIIESHYGYQIDFNGELGVDEIKEIIKKVKDEYIKLYGTTRIGRIPYRVDMIRLLVSDELSRYLTHPVPMVIPERLIRPKGLFKNIYLCMHDPDKKRREKMYRYYDIDALSHCLIDSSKFFSLLERTDEIRREIYTKIFQNNKREMEYKSGFKVCLFIFSLNKLEELEECKYLKTNEEIISVLGIPPTTFKNRMKDFFKIDRKKSFWV